MPTETDIGVLISKVITGFSIFVSSPFYLFVIFVIFKNRHKVPFDSPFFTIFMLLGLVDVVVYHVFNICKLAFLKIEWDLLMPYNKPNIFGKVVIFINWWLAYMQFQLTILSCLNRVISIVWTGLYREYWTSRVTKLILSGTTFICMCFAIPILFTDVTVLRYSTTLDGITKVRTVGPTFANTKVSGLYMLSWKINVYAILIVCTACYSVMFYKVREIRAASKTSAMQRELRLLYPMTVMFVCNCLYVAFFALFDYYTANNNLVSQNFQWLIYIASDAYDLNNGYVIMMTSSEVRNAVFQFLGIKFKNKTVPVVSFTTSNNL